VIRPLAYAREKEIAEFAELKNYPVIPCNLCGTQENLQRGAMKQMLSGWDKQFPGRIETIFNSLQNIKPSQMMDKSLFDFDGLTQSEETKNESLGQPIVFQPRQVNE
jgi:tRNA 2-thiocytidine biosynthesis protein TtcA